MEKVVVVCAVALGSLAWGGGCSKGHSEEAPPSSEGQREFVEYGPDKAPLEFIKIMTVTESSSGAAVSLTGRVTFDEDHTQRVASPIDGRAIRLLVKQGDGVRAGQPLIELSSPNVGQLQADAQKALADLKVSEKSIERVHKLQIDGAVADKEVAQSEGDYHKAKSDYGRTTTQLKALGVSPTDPAVTVALRAQIPGTVVERNVLVGQEVRADQATPLLTISSLDSVWVLADVYERDLALVHQGDQVTIKVPAYPDRGFSARIGHIGEVIDPNTRTVKIRCVAANPDHLLKPEMFAAIEVQSAISRKLIAVPSKAILNEGDKSFVVVATEGNVFRQRQVDVGPDLEGQVRILKGLLPGEKIVGAGAIFMKREIESQ
jgi:cobalt-zinc-cadmium efflux system membrane fusion protein